YFRLRSPARRRDAEPLVNIRHLHVRRLGSIAQEVDPADRAHDAAGPGIRAAAEERGRTLAGEFLGQLATEDGVFVVHACAAERLDQTQDGLQYPCRFLLPLRLRAWFGYLKFRRGYQRSLRHRQGRDDAGPGLGLLETLVQRTPDAAAERNVVTIQYAVV